VAYCISVIFACAAAGIAWGQPARGGFEGPGRYVITNTDSRKALELDRLDHRTVIQSSLREHDSQRWDIEKAGPDLFYVRNASDGRALEASGANGVAACARFNGGVNQQWRIEPGKEGSALIVSQDGRALEIPEGSSMDGARVRVAEPKGEVHQRFAMRRVRKPY
jgi:hypothetical protein